MHKSSWNNDIAQMNQKSDKSDNNLQKTQTRQADTWWHDKWLEVFRRTGNVSKACESVAINRDTAYHHRKLFPIFKQQWEDTSHSHVDLLEQTAHERAIAGDTTLLIFLLKNRKPEIYRETTRTEISFEKMSDAELREFIKSATDEPR